MKIAFFSNFLNHHQLPFCLAMQRLTNDQFVFVATTPTPADRLSMGYHDMNKHYAFVLTTYDSEENEKKAMELALNCDVIITGSAPEKYTRERIKRNRITFRYSERPYKQGIARAYRPRNIVSWMRHHTRYAFKPLYMLCASAYTAFDHSLLGAYVGKTYKWGYFPEVKEQDLDALFARKRNNVRPKILWVARLLPLKHPEAAVETARFLKEQGKQFDMDIIGNGEMEEELKAMIRTQGLEDCVRLLGSMSPEAVREHMEQADIFLFTSDFNEGWGAVLNESMNSACAVVASHAIGSVPFLMRDGENGLVYKNGDTADLCRKVLRLVEEPNERERMGREAYQTLAQVWNADAAAERFLKLAEDLQTGKKSARFAEGPCSPAEIMRNGWYK